MARKRYSSLEANINPLQKRKSLEFAVIPSVTIIPGIVKFREIEERNAADDFHLKPPLIHITTPLQPK